MSKPTDEDAILAGRYHRQTLLPGIGEAGQAAIRRATVGVVGCGALGSVIIDHLARAGVGRLILIDRDVVEATNLQRQVLYTEQDVIDAVPKAEAAARAVAASNRDVVVERHVVDLGPSNVRTLLADADVIVDGLDNFETRYLLNDLAVATGRPYVYGGAVGTSGMSLVVMPDHGPCLRCIFDAPPAPGTGPTCDTAGVLAPATATVAARQAAETLKIAAGRTDAVDRRLMSVDLWTGEHRAIDVASGRRDDCPCCGKRHFAWLDGEMRTGATTLCGRTAVQIAGPAADSGTDPEMDLAVVAERLEAFGRVRRSDLLLRARLDAEPADSAAGGETDRTGDARGTDRETPSPVIEITLFGDGRAIIHGTSDPIRARALYARFVGC